MIYDTSNIFAKILRGEIPVTPLYDDAFALAFSDIAPCAPLHVLVIPKGAYRDYEDFMTRASDAEILGFFRAVQRVAQQQGASSYRLISNCGAQAGQTVPHFHVHVLAGKTLGALIAD